MPVLLTAAMPVALKAKLLYAPAAILPKSISEAYLVVPKLLKSAATTAFALVSVTFTIPTAWLVRVSPVQD